MKKFFFLFAVLIGLSVSTSAQKRFEYEKLPVLKDFTEEAEAMKSRNMPMLVIFSSPYCIYCEKIIHTHIPVLEKDPRFAGKVLFRNVDFDNPQSMMVDEAGDFVTVKEYSEKYDISFFPEIVFLDHEGKELSAKIKGFEGDEKTRKLLETALLESLKKLGSKS